MIRFFDFFFSILGLIFLFPIFILLWIVGFLENGSPIFKQKRIGYFQKSFFLIKFRTMKKNTKSIATHLVNSSMITPLGHFLRQTKLDEAPQLLNVLKGDMSFVGPRPCLANQKKLISERKKRGIFNVRPGITGLAQIRGITMEKPILLSKIELEMIKKMNLYYYFHYIFVTLYLIFRKKL
jgi:lipopolysaccharide/colanic/teichoic acid biosynthesis glycosyltransferase